MTPARTRRTVSMGTLSLLILMGSMWGLQFSMLKLAGRGAYSDLSIVAMSLVLLSSAFLLVSWASGELFRPTRRQIPFFVVTAVLGYILPLIATLHASDRLEAGIITIVACLAPVVTLAAAPTLAAERISLTQALAVALGCASVLMIMLPELDLPGQGRIPWLLVALTIPVCYGLESVYVSRFWPQDLTPLQLVTGETLVATILVAPALLFWGEGLPNVAQWSESETGIVIFVAAGVIEGVAYFRIIQTSGVLFVNFGTFVGLITGVLWGILLFGERHGSVVWLATVVLAAALIVVFRDMAQSRGNNPCRHGQTR